MPSELAVRNLTAVGADLDGVHGGQVPCQDGDCRPSTDRAIVAHDPPYPCRSVEGRRDQPRAVVIEGDAADPCVVPGELSHEVSGIRPPDADCPFGTLQEAVAGAVAGGDQFRVGAKHSAVHDTFVLRQILD